MAAPGWNWGRSVARLGLVLDQILFACGDQWSTDEVFIRFIERLARTRFDEVRFCSRTTRTDKPAPYALDASLFEIVPLPWYRDIKQLCTSRAHHFPRIVSALRNEIPGWDLAIASGIHPVSATALRIARRRRVPSALWVRGNLMADIAYRTAGLEKIVALLAARLFSRAIPANTPVISMGRRDYPFLRRLGPVQVAYSSKFTEEDVLTHPRRPATNRSAPGILYVGRISPEKGIEVLVEAMGLLRARHGLEATLTVVGSDYFGSAWGDGFIRRVRSSEVSGAVTFTGYVPFGPRLVDLYDAHDILVLPSFTEGFPQVVLEAMARGLPVVATEVGGVPEILRHGQNGVLVPAGNRDNLADAVATLWRSSELWIRLSENGLVTARGFTAEKQVRSVLAFLDDRYPGRSFAARGSV